MKVAMVDGWIWLVDVGERFNQLKELGMTWNRKKKRMECQATLENFCKLKRIFKLPPELEAECERLRAKHVRMEQERGSDSPVPCMDFPVKAKLYKHQIRAVNMALIQFDVI